VVASGIGKSGIVARKIAATLTSTGTPAIFLHPVESLHGDLGIVSPADVALLVSRSGETSELAGLIEHLVRLGVPIIALAGRPGSALARNARAVLDCSVAEEACPLDLAPTSSTTAALAMGDALAVAVFRMKGLRPEQFALLHPGGALGRKLTLRVEDVMVGEGYPVLPETARMRESVVPIAEKRGTVPVVDGSGLLVGVLTAGDLTRLIERDEGWPDRSVAEVMTRSPRTATLGELAPPRPAQVRSGMTVSAKGLRRRIGGCLAVLALGACGERAATPVASEDIQGMTSDMVGFGTDTYLTTNGVRTGAIKADTAYFFEDSTVVHMRGVDMAIHTEQGAVRATVTARRGRYDERSQQMHAVGDVVLILPNENRRVESGELYYNPNDGRIWSDSATTYHQANGQITRGTCFNSDLSFTNIFVCNIRGAADVAP
jgi:arabinose-5-phosphate isomerase